MPSLQLDAPVTLDVGARRDLARRLAWAYAEIMGTSPELVTVVIHESSVWRDGEPSALLMCDVRRGRTVETRAELSRAVIAICAEATGIEPKVEFTQHAGDEMYHPWLGGFIGDWEG